MHQLFLDGALQTVPVQSLSCHGTRTERCLTGNFLAPLCIMVSLSPSYALLFHLLNMLDNLID